MRFKILFAVSYITFSVFFTYSQVTDKQSKGNIEKQLHDVDFFEKYNCKELKDKGFDVIVDDQNHKVEIPMSKPRNVLKLTELLIRAVVDREKNEKNHQNMTEILGMIENLLTLNDEDLDNDFCKNHDSFYQALKVLSDSLDGRLLELKKLFENLMFFIRVSAYTVKLNQYFEQHEDKLIKFKKDLSSISRHYKIVDVPPELLHGVTAGVDITTKKHVGKSDGAFIIKNETVISGKAGVCLSDAVIGGLASLNAEIQLKISDVEKHQNVFSIASLQNDVWSDKNYTKFKNLLQILLSELSQLKINLYNLDLRLKTIGIIKNDLSYYFDMGQYTTEYIKSYSLGGKIFVTSSLLSDIGLEAALCYKVSRHKKGKNHIPDNIKNYSVILHNREYALSLVKLFNSGVAFGRILDGKSNNFEKKITSKGIYSIADVRFHVDNYLHALKHMYQKDERAVKPYLDLKHQEERDLGTHRRKDTAEFFTQILAYFCFKGKDLNGNQCDENELTGLKDSIVSIMSTIEDSKSKFSSRRELRQKKAHSHEVTANICLGKMIDFYCQFNEKKTRIYENGQMMYIDVNLQLLNWLNSICLSKLPINAQIKGILGKAVKKIGDEFISNIFFEITDKIHEKIEYIINNKSKIATKYIPLGLSFFSCAVDNLRDTISDNCNLIQDKTPLELLTGINPKRSLVKINFVANSMEETSPIMTKIISIPNVFKKRSDGITIKEQAKTFINALTVYELVKDFIIVAMEYEANHGSAVTLKKANDFVSKYKFIDHLVKSAKKGLLNSSYIKYANATKHGLAFQQSLKGEPDDEIKKYLSMLVYHYYLDKAKPFFENSFK